MTWDADCRTLIDYMQRRQQAAPHDESPTMAIMPTKMVAAFMGVSREEALVWLTANAEYQGDGLWLVTAKK